jgi:predicted dehydrogenase/nucleoside-diphosphate-sugar epimerase
MDPGTPLRVAIVGCGRVAQHHARWIKKLNGVGLIAVADIDALLVEEFATAWDVPSFYLSLDELLSAEDVDVVHITTPAGLHFSQARQCIESGINVFVEKPFSLSVADATRLYELAESNGVMIGVNFIQLYHSAFQDLVKLVRSGGIGDIISVHVYYGLDLGMAELRDGWPAHWSYRLPGGVLHNYLTHPLYMVAALIEGPFRAHVTARAAGAQPQDTTDRIHIQVDGTVSSASVVIAAGTAGASTVHVYGSAGRATVDFGTHTFSSVVPTPGPRALGLVLTNPRKSAQLFGGTVRFVWGVLTRRLVPYQGLGPLLSKYYAALGEGGAGPTPERLVLDVAGLEEQIVPELGRVHLSCKIRAGSQDDVTQVARVLVTGGTGYLGPDVVRQLRCAGFFVRVLARTTSSLREVESLGAEVVFGDLRDFASISEAASGIDVIVNLAASLRGSTVGMLQTATEGILNVARAADEHGVERVLHISSASVYDFMEVSARRPITEDTALEPEPEKRGGATAAKLAAEHLVLAEMRSPAGPAWTILRPTLLFGRGRDVTTPLGRSLGRLVISLGVGRRWLRLIHTRDVGRAVVSALSTSITRGRVYNLSHPDELSVRQYVREILPKSDRRVRVVRIPYLVVASAAKAANFLSRLRGGGEVIGRRRLRYMFAGPKVEMRAFCEDTGWVPEQTLRDQLLSELGEGRQAS